LADKDKLQESYGRDLLRARLPANPRVEEIPKADVLKGLTEATRDTQKGEYHKTKHAPDLLQLIRADRVRAAAPNCQRLFERLRGALNE